MRLLFAALSTIIGMIGLVFILQGGNHPSKYQEVLSENVRAVQVTQIYTEATYKITLGIGIMSLAVLVAVLGILLHARKPLNPDPSSIIDNLEDGQPFSADE